MNTIILTGRKPSDEMNFRNEVVRISKEWEENYNVNLKDLGDDIWSLIFKFNEKYENRSTLLLDADILTSYFEQRTEFQVTTLLII